MAKIVVFEGPDKVGKETQSKMLLDALQASGLRAMRVEVPSKLCPKSYKLIYWTLRNGWAKRVPNVFQFIQFLNKWLFQRAVLPGLLKTLDVVIFDRWSLSAVIYGNATDVNEPFNMWLYGKLKRPDVTIVMAQKSYRRATTTDDSYEKDSDLQTRVREGYVEWAVFHAEDHVLVNNDQPVLDVHHEIVRELSMFGIL